MTRAQELSQDAALDQLLFGSDLTEAEILASLIPQPGLGLRLPDYDYDLEADY